MSPLFGNRVTDSNTRLRLLLFAFFGMISLASILFWKQKLLLSADYVDFPQANHTKLSHDFLEE